MVLIRELIDPLLTPDKAIGGITEEEANKLVEQMGHEDFATREQAVKTLIKKGRFYKKLLIEATKAEDPEKKMRAKKVLEIWAQEKGNSRLNKLNGQEKHLLKYYFLSSFKQGKFEEFRAVHKALLEMDQNKYPESQGTLNFLAESFKSHLNSQISTGDIKSPGKLILLAEEVLSNKDFQKMFSTIMILYLADNKKEKAHGLFLQYPQNIKKTVEFQEKLFADLSRFKHNNREIDYFTARVESIKDIAEVLPENLHSSFSPSFMPNNIQFSREEGWEQALKWAEQNDNPQLSLLENEFAIYIKLLYSRRHPEGEKNARQAVEKFFQRVFAYEKLSDKRKLAYYFNFWDSSLGASENINQSAAKFAPQAISIFSKQGKDVYQMFDLAKALNFYPGPENKKKAAGETLCQLWKNRKYKGSDSRYLPAMIELYLSLGKKDQLMEILKKRKRFWREFEYYAVFAKSGCYKTAVDNLKENWKSLAPCYTSYFSKITLSDETLNELNLLLDKENPDFAIFAKIFFANFARVQKYKDDRYNTICIHSKRFEMIC